MAGVVLVGVAGRLAINETSAVATGLNADWPIWIGATFVVSSAPVDPAIQPFSTPPALFTK